MDRADVSDRIDSLAERAARDRDQFTEPQNPPDEEGGLACLRDGAGQVVGLYTHARTGGRMVAFSEAEWERMETAMNTWFELYAAYHGHDIEMDVPVRTAAELLVETHNIRDVAQLLTGVPDRRIEA